VSQFYCCGKFKSESISFVTEKHQNCQGDNEKPGCCQTTHHYIKVSDNHFAAQLDFSFEKVFTILHTDFPSFQLTAPQVQLGVGANNINAPPILPGNPIYIFNCTYRI
ncbi:MAG: hypothetical protein ABI861_07865, partial [Panacibacter sp.]